MLTAGDRVFCDTNVLLAATDRSRAEHADCQRALTGCGEHGVDCYTAPQILREYLVVATRPADVNGLGLSMADARANLRAWRRRAYLLDEDAAVCKRLDELLAAVDCRGKRVHDANVLAVMRCHGIEHLITANGSEFAAFHSVIPLRIWHPSDVVFGR